MPPSNASRSRTRSTAWRPRARRRRPLVDDLRGPAPARSRATKQLAGLPADDKFHVYARVIDAPNAFDKPVAVAAVLALVDDPRASDMSLSAAIADMRYHGQ